MFDTLLYDKQDGIAWVTLNRPEVLNAINMRMRDELWDVMHAVRDDPEVQVVIFKGAGERAFSAGADISEFGTAPSYVESRRARRERDLWGFILSLEVPLIAAIHGYALGAGIELPMCCDLRIASEDARLGLPEVSLGYIPSAGGRRCQPLTGIGTGQGSPGQAALQRQPLSQRQVQPLQHRPLGQAQRQRPPRHQRARQGLRLLVQPLTGYDPLDEAVA